MEHFLTKHNKLQYFKNNNLREEIRKEILLQHFMTILINMENYVFVFIIEK